MTRTGEYQKADPAAAGLDPVTLKAAMGYANLSHPLTMKVFRHGCLLAQGPRDRLFDRVPANNWGQTKTITALITGIAQDQGLLTIDTPIGAYLPADLGDATHRAVTLRNLLQQSSGFEITKFGWASWFKGSRRWWRGSVCGFRDPDRGRPEQSCIRRARPEHQ